MKLGFFPAYEVKKCDLMSHIFLNIDDMANLDHKKIPSSSVQTPKYELKSISVWSGFYRGWPKKCFFNGKNETELKAYIENIDGFQFHTYFVSFGITDPPFLWIRQKWTSLKVTVILRVIHSPPCACLLQFLIDSTIHSGQKYVYLLYYLLRLTW